MMWLLLVQLVWGIVALCIVAEVPFVDPTFAVSLLAIGPVLGVGIFLWTDTEPDLHDNVEYFLSRYDDDPNTLQVHEQWIRQHIKMLKTYKKSYIAVDTVKNQVVLVASRFKEFERKLEALDLTYSKTLLCIHTSLVDNFV